MTSTVDAAASLSVALAAASSASAAAAAAATEAAISAAIESSAGTTFGALLDGGLVAFLLYGFACAQTWEYFVRYKSDGSYMKVLVGIIWALNTVHRFFDVNMLWFYLVSRGEGNILNLLSANWSILARLFPSEIAITLVQCFFVMRIWLFSERRAVSWILLVPIVASLAFAMAYIVRAFQFPAFSDAPKQKWIVICYSSIRAGTDILISLVLSWLLYQKGKVSMSHLKGVLRILFQYTITTGVLASSMATLVVIMFVCRPDNLVYIGLYDVYGILFFNCMMASLNSRENLRAVAHRDHILSDLSSGHNSVRVQVPVVQTVEYTFDDREVSKSRFTESHQTSVRTTQEDAEANYQETK